MMENRKNRNSSLITPEIDYRLSTIFEPKKSVPQLNLPMHRSAEKPVAAALSGKQVKVRDNWLDPDETERSFRN